MTCKASLHLFKTLYNISCNSPVASSVLTAAQVPKGKTNPQHLTIMFMLFIAVFFTWSTADHDTEKIFLEVVLLNLLVVLAQWCNRKHVGACKIRILKHLAEFLKTAEFSNERGLVPTLSDGCGMLYNRTKGCYVLVVCSTRRCVAFVSFCS